MSLYVQAMSVFFGLFIVLLYLEERMAEYIILNLKYLWIKIQSYWLMINLHPRNPIYRIKTELKYYFIARSLQKEINKHPKIDTND